MTSVREKKDEKDVTSIMIKKDTHLEVLDYYTGEQTQGPWAKNGLLHHYLAKTNTEMALRTYC